MALFLLLLLLAVCPSFEAKLNPDYYAKSCPKAEKIVQEVVIQKQITSPTTAGATVRLFFHDCFVNGCDASVMITSTPFNKAERDADINLSLPGDGFDVVVRAKSELELQCPGVVSCADIISIATRDLISMVGGPYFKVKLGRKDGLVSKASLVNGNLPESNMTVTEMIKLFESKGFTSGEMLALVGAHTIGFSHCKEFAKRIYNYGPHGQVDPTLNARYAQGLQQACSNYTKDPTIATFNDIMTPNKFDNMYYQNLRRGLGLLSTDQDLYSDNRTKGLVDTFATNQTDFFNAFVAAIEKLSLLGVKVGNQGEVRRRCDEFNS